MKSLYPLILFCLCGGTLFAQVGIGTNTPNANAVLELKSPGNNQGFLVPRLTTAQRTTLTLTAAENGMMVFDSDENKFYYWQSAQWLPLRSGNDLQAGAGINITGSTIAVVPDGDGNATNEIQDLQLNGNTLTITKNASATPIDLAPFAGTNTDNQTLAFNGGTGVLTISGGNSVTLTEVVLQSETPTGGAISGTFAGGLQINNDAVTSAKILDGTIATTDLANNAVTVAKIANGAVTPAKIAPGSALQVLTTVAGAAVWANLPAIGTGTVTSVTAGSGLAGGVISTTGTISLGDTKVVPGSYGSSTQIPTFTVDQQGRLQAAGSVAVSAGGGEGLGETLKINNDAGAQDAFNFKSISINTGASAGPGALNVNGSHFSSFTTFSDGYVIKPDDYILISTPGKPATIDLPKAAENRGRILIFKSTGSSTGDGVRVNAPEGLDGGSASEILYMDSNGGNVAFAITVLCTGTTWVMIDRAISPPNFKG